MPLVMVMYFLIALLEDCGYMARVSAVMDPIFKRVGLSGKSVIPVVIGTGCGIPAIMACRTIRDERERRATSMLATFIPCGAKIPVIALFAGAFFNGAGWVSTLSYFFGLVLIFLGALLIKAITGYKYRKSFFIIELPKFKVPSLKFAFKSMMERAKAYILKAATIILICNTVVQVMQTFNWSFQVVEEGMENTSILASIANPFALLLIPLGFGVWQLAAAAITGFIAKENVVGTLAVVYGLTAFIDVDELALTGGANEVALTMGLTSVTALAYLFFNLYTPPCFAAIGAMNSEMKSRAWLWGAIGLQLGTGYTVAFLIYQFGTLFTEGHLGTAFVPGLIAVALMVLAVVMIGKRTRAHFDAQYSLHQK
ncbi:MAG: nucleoside recognition domain-containing protein [Erysipelotrichaceae bacterium]|nr:nucleoside recognition domain-containing protein [Erysipelotrichaceae bacterium]